MDKMTITLIALSGQRVSMTFVFRYMSSSLSHKSLLADQRRYIILEESQRRITFTSEKQVQESQHDVQVVCICERE